jgi:hypothetical protein
MAQKQGEYAMKSTEPVTSSHALTAVDWLINQLEELLYSSTFERLEEEFVQAKAMEKKQIKKAFEEGGVQYMSNIGDDRPPKAEDYYNKNYKKCD